MYVDIYSEAITKKLSKIKKKDEKHYVVVRKKMDWILENPRHNYKYLHYNRKGEQRIHIGSYVLVFKINHGKSIVSFEDYEHHDSVYS